MLHVLSYNIHHMATIDIHIFWKGKRRDLRMVLYLSMCALIMWWSGVEGGIIVFFFLVLAYPILAKIDRDRDRYGEEDFPTLKKWFSKFKK